MEMYPIRNHKVDSSYDKQKQMEFFAQGDNGGRSHNRYYNKGNDMLRRKRQSNMRSIGYGISSSVRPKKLHLTYEDYWIPEIIEELWRKFTLKVASKAEQTTLKPSKNHEKQNPETFDKIISQKPYKKKPTSH